MSLTCIYLESIPCTIKASKSSFGSRYESIASENCVLNEPVLESSRPKDGTYTGRTGPITFIERLNPAVDNIIDGIFTRLATYAQKNIVVSLRSTFSNSMAD